MVAMATNCCHCVVNRGHVGTQFFRAIDKQAVLAVESQASCFIAMCTAVLGDVPRHGEQRLVRLRHFCQIEQPRLKTLNAAQPQPHHQHVPGGEAVVDRPDRALQLIGDVSDGKARPGPGHARQCGVKYVVIGVTGRAWHAIILVHAI